MENCNYNREFITINYCTGELEVPLICYNCEEDGCKWEWDNCYENDGTPDNSAWTSIETDGILETSPSLDEGNADDVDDDIDDGIVDDDDLPDDVEIGKSLENEMETSVSVEESTTCVACKFDSKKNKAMCFNGIQYIP